MAYIGTFGISSSGMAAERLRLDAISNNLANMNTTRAEDGEPYKRVMVEFQAQPGLGGVKVSRLVRDDSPPLMVHDPGHPDANADGYVAMPNISPVNEMVDMITATRAYEANVAAFNAAKSMVMKALEIGKA